MLFRSEKHGVEHNFVQVPELTKEQRDEIEAWVRHELTTGEKTITRKEAIDGAKAFAKKHGFTITEDMWEEMDRAFDHVDTNDDGAIDADELAAAIENHGK